MKKIIILILCVLKLYGSHALNAPDLRCLEISANGDVQLTWLTPSDLTGFSSYEIYRSASISGTYTLVDIINTATVNNYTHVGAGANGSQAYYYYIAAKDASQTYSSGILSTIVLNLSNSQNNIAVLSWNAMSGTSSSDHIYREYSGVFSDVAQTASLNFRDTVYYCKAELHYQIRVFDPSGCVSTSAVRTDNFQNNATPRTPKINVTVDMTDSLNHILWEPNLEVNVVGYTVFRQDNGMFVPIDILYGRYNTEYIDKTKNPYEEVSYYRVSALDTCATPAMSLPQSNFQLNRIDFYLDAETCKASYSLFWTPYHHADSCRKSPERFQYQIWVSQNDAPFIQIGEIPCSGSSFSDNVSRFQIGSAYTFVIKAVDSDKATAMYSTKYSFVFNQDITEDTVYIRYVKVQSETEIEIAVYAGSRLLPESVELYRSDYGKNNYVKVDEKEATHSSDYLFSDRNTIPASQRYEYKVVLKNACNSVSNIASTILLTGDFTGEAETGLTWTPYEGFDDEVESYTVFRKLENVSWFEERYRDYDFSYKEDVWDLATTGNKFAYYVEAVENENNRYGFKEVSRSNTVILEKSAILFIPNAFYPSGYHNPVFKPSNLFITTTNYSMKIFNRTGSLVFSTTDPNTGWDGRTKDGKSNPSGVYIYVIEFTDKNEEYREYQGIVTLVE